MADNEIGFSVVLSTYNRGPLLEGALRSLLALDAASPPHEVVVVDNNSRDHTRELVHALIPESDGRMRYVFEGRQGLSHARNAGVAASRGAVVAFTDDDVRAQPDWLIAMAAAFAAHPDVMWMGGKVLPMYPSAPPEWLTRDQWSPLAILDFGDEPFAITRERFTCMVGANLAVRRAAFDVVGGFDPRFQHEPGAVTACEDNEFEIRLVNAGLVGRYEPALVIRAEVQPNRLTREYHRKWWYDHGRAVVRMTPAGHTLFNGGATYDPVPPHAKHVFGVPAVLAKLWGRALVRHLRARARGDRDTALWYYHELCKWRGMAAYYATARRRELAAHGAAAPPRLPPARAGAAAARP